MKKHYRKETNCLNCGTNLQGKFCHHCGQENLEIKESFGHMMNHAISDYFHFDHQFFHTLKPLISKPGKLTNEYMAGKRAQYLHPIKMYIFISLVYFVLLFGNHKQTENAESKPATKEQTDDVIKRVNSNPALSSTQKALIIDRVRKRETANQQNQQGSVSEKADDEKSSDALGVIIDKTSTDSTYEAYLAQQSKLPPNKRDGFIKRFATKKKFDYKKYGSRANEMFWEDFKHNIPKMMFVLLPLFALILKLTFWDKNKFYVEHLIYSFHVHCFLFLLFAFVILVSLILPQGSSIEDWLDFLTVVATIWYIYRSLRSVYHRSRARTITKMLGMSLAYLFAFVICLAGVMLITIINIK